MAYEQCLLEIQKAAGRDLTPDERKQIGKTVSDIMQRLDKEGTADELNAKILQAVDEFTQDVTAAAIIEKRNAALNAKSKLMTRDYLSNVWADDPKEGIKAILGNSLVNRQGARNGVAAHQDALSNNYVSGMMAELAEKQVMDLATSGKLDDQIWTAMAELNMPAPDTVKLTGLSPDAVEIAKVFNKYTELSRVQANAAGAWIKKLPGYVIRRSHDVGKIQKAAGAALPVNSPKHFEAWRDFISDRLDWGKTMSDVPMEKRAEILSDMYQQFANGIHLRFGEGGVAGLKGFNNVGKKLSHERVLQFKSPEAEFEYHKKFGRDGSLSEAMVSGLMNMGRDTALMRKLGPNAKANLDAAVNEVKQKYVKEGKGNLAKDLGDEYDDQMRKLWPLLDGSASIAANHSAAQWNQTIRNFEIMGDLGGAVLSGPSDLAFYASTMRYIGDRTTGSFFKGLNESVSHLVGGIGKSVTPEQMKLASELGIMLDAIKSPVARVQADTNIPGRTSGWVEKFFKFNGLSWWQDQLRLGAVMATAHRQADNIAHTFDKLPTGTQALLKQFDIKPAEWDVIRAGKLHVDSEGRSFLTPESVLDVDDAVIKAHIEANGKTATPAKIKNTRTELADKYRALFKEVGAMATSEPGKMERSIMLQGTKAGTAIGEVLRHFWMYKSFTVSVMRKHLGREIWGYGADKLPIHQALFQMVKDPKNSGLGGMANLIVFGTMMGYISMSLKDLAKGRTPRIPTDGKEFMKVFAASAAQSGSMGIYGDFLFGEMKSRMGQGPLETFMGPTYKRFSDVTDLWGRLKNGDDVAAKAFNFALNNTPVVNSAYNLFYTRAALDYLLVYRMQEMMNPGYLRRMEQKLKREKQQEYLLPPSGVVPYGG